MPGLRIRPPVTLTNGERIDAVIRDNVRKQWVKQMHVTGIKNYPAGEQTPAPTWFTAQSGMRVGAKDLLAYQKTLQAEAAAAQPDAFEQSGRLK